MQLNKGRPLTAMPGPSIMPDSILAAIHCAMPNIYDGTLIETSLSLFADLPKIVRTNGEAFIAISNGHGAWEMALTNTLNRGDKILVLEAGSFATGWGEQAGMLGCEVEILHAPARAAVNPAAVEDRLRADKDHSIKAVLVVQVDTASGVRNDIAAIRSAIDAAHHPALYMVDCIASLGCIEYSMDAWRVDVTVSASQKGLMVPPGLGFVWAGEKAFDAHAQANLRTPYWDWTRRLSDGPHYLKYCGTPPIQHIYALRAALDMLEDEGLENVWVRHRVLADAVRAAIAAWSAPKGLEFNILNPAERSDSTTTILTGDIDSRRLQTICKRDAGLTLGIGLGELSASSFRIGHMGHLNPPTILGILGTVEAALIHMGAPMGSSGAAAAANVIAEALDK